MCKWFEDAADYLDAAGRNGKEARMNDFDFTRMCIANADGPDVPLNNAPVAADGCRVTAMFGNLEESLCDLIRRADFVLGCVAWLTNKSVLHSLAVPREGVQIVVQKEDWLRPDYSTSFRESWKSGLRELYDDLECCIDRYSLSEMLGMPVLSMNADSDEDAVRCAGNHNSAKHPAFPRMHHKFFVFCDVWRDAEYQMPCRISPRAVWTGSFNPTANGTRSRENAVLIESAELAAAYAREWFQVYAISEPLDWESQWCEPQYRIGT
jgi:hypothetical protein